MSNIAAWVAHAEEAEVDLQTAAATARDSLHLSNQSPSPTAAQPLSRSQSRNASPCAVESGVHLQLPRSPSMISPGRPVSRPASLAASPRPAEMGPHLQLPRSSSSFSPSRKPMDQQGQVAGSQRMHAHQSNSPTPARLEAQGGTSGAASRGYQQEGLGGQETPPSVYQRILHSASRRGGPSPSPRQLHHNPTTLPDTNRSPSPLSRQLQHSFTAAASPAPSHPHKATQDDAQQQDALGQERKQEQEQQQAQIQNGTEQGSSTGQLSFSPMLDDGHARGGGDGAGAHDEDGGAANGGSALLEGEGAPGAAGVLWESDL
ncbi:hypothetical protein DUNSADRAFT_4546 [Dunaliella salina]|uniref:Encoded protein n=1 Tax=Dunaliella salina TaxID=3046 RepID=A0ABQ7FUT4_DUNSA|nr:hypothetical protein DUNSADRAFT_4546 [Dunaliella salina]|eukprot:KAF5826150.1 hypothetical protein DUNSADRAFT_4546 [Dunaliella salina]